MSKYTLPELAYDYSALEPHYSGRLLELHHGRHHAGYVTGANETLERLDEARAEGDFAAINQLQKNLAFHLSGHVLHSLLWKNLSPRGGGEPNGEHAYYLEHENMKGNWVSAFWKLADWSDVAKRFSSVRTLDLVL